MRWLSEVHERLRGLLFRAREDAAMDEEMRFHLEMEAERLVREQGLDPREARRRAAVAFGGVEKHKEEVREARGLAWVPGLSLDLKLGLRMLVKYPGLTLVGGLGMAVAIAISVGFFAFFLLMIYPEIPLEEGDRIVALENRDLEVNNEDGQALHDFVTWREELETVDDLGAFQTVRRNLILGDAPPELVPVAEMTASGFRLARVPPLLGRYLVEEDEREGAPPVVVIGHDVWRARFASDPGIVGREVRLGNTVHSVVGVMPEGFAFPENHGYWVPFRYNPSEYERREGPEIFVFGRLAPGVSMEEAQAELAAIGRRTAAAFPETHAQIRPMVMPYTYSLTDMQDISLWEVAQMQLMMSLLLIVVALNVAVLVFARTATRQGEIAVRAALGARRRRIVAQLFLEALVLSTVAAAVGLALAQVGIELGTRIMEQEMEVGVPFWMDYGLRPATVLYTVGLTILAAVIVGVLPALQATGRRLQANLRQLGGATGMRLGKLWTVLIVAQVAIAVAALPAAVNFGLSAIRSGTTRPAYPAEEFLTAWLATETEPPRGVDAETYQRETAARFGGRLSEVVRRLEAEPGVAGVTFLANLPGRDGLIEVEGVPAPVDSPAGHDVNSIGVNSGYFDVFGARILTGRGFGSGDFGEEATAVVVDRAFVRQVLGGGDALGRRIRYVDVREDPEAGEAEPGPWLQIVGVVEDLETNAMDPALVTARLYYPVSPAQLEGAALRVRLRGSTPSSFAPRLREITVDVDPTLRLGVVRSLADSDLQERLAMRLVALAVGLVLLSVLLLSAAGIYAMMSFTVTQRRKEIGIRTALGADPRRILGSIFSRAVGQLALGLAGGVGAAFLIEGLTGGGLMGGEAAMILPAVAALMLCAGLLATLGPALRGLRVQPMEALREE